MIIIPINNNHVIGTFEARNCGKAAAFKEEGSIVTIDEENSPCHSIMRYYKYRNLERTST